MNKTLPALPGKAPALPPGAFEIGYTAHDGALHRVPLAEAAVVRFADTQPTRRIRTRKGQRHHRIQPRSSKASTPWTSWWSAPLRGAAVNHGLATGSQRGGRAPRPAARLG
jgi:hypothetical protein